MRDIKFRAWDEENKVMEYNIDIQSGKAVKEGYQFYNTENTLYDSKPMQFTGMQYYNNKEEIYEHDVVKGKVFKKGEESRFIGIVKYSHYPTPGFRVEGVKQYEGLKESLHPLFKPIGNIYENPELVR